MTLIPAAASVLALSVGPVAPGCELSISMQKETGTPVSATVLCEPVSGTHSRAAAVCASLSAVDGDLTKVVPSDSMCPDYFDPVTVTVKGYWHERKVDFTRTYSNQCFANIALGKIVEF
jgi:hypothetical protein